MMIMNFNEHVECIGDLSNMGITVRPLLSGHVGTGAHPDKGFGRIWETQCLIHAAAYPMVSQCLNASYLEENLM